MLDWGNTLLPAQAGGGAQSFAERIIATLDGWFPGWEWWLTGLVALGLLCALFGVSYYSRSGIIARATRKEAVRQPVFILLTLVAIVFLIVNTFLPFFSMGDDVKMLKDVGLAMLQICGLLMAIWTASTSIAAEIEGKTAMTLLSKPINRRQFIVGKYLGILQAVVLMLLPIAIVFLFLIYYKVGYDARESSQPYVDWLVETTIGGQTFLVPGGLRLSTSLQIIPGLALIFLEIAVLSAVSVAVSTRLPMVMNMVTCISVFVIAHLTPVLVKSVFQGLEFVKFTSQMIATVLPSLAMFDTQGAVATGTLVPPDYLGLSLLYSTAYCIAAILAAFILFEDRDLA